nr:immunoglobulin heavy chain junction region [Macaca mulatta]MOX59364.1 immunoglobulin heavy chain junction region [Macaca mulatta]MOX61285.1 immunoglobulin heavy chain junction region [Macaca mulatta]MOX62976.1 immunoglobulin heavy chain junction region [Macaca mulatta]MOX64196.1 immunoglobulin heavy chain junction region [Macaca mulatta]
CTRIWCPRDLTSGCNWFDVW